MICVARGIGITTGQQLAQFLNRVGVRPFQEPAWTKNSANRAVEYLVKKKLLVWPRHRGKRNPTLETMRKTYFAEAVKMCRKVERYGTAE